MNCAMNNQICDALSKNLREVINSAESDLDECVRKGAEFDSNDKKSGFKFILLLFFAKAIDISRSILAVLKADITLWREASALGRGLLEIFISARIMKTDPIKLAERFDHFNCVRRYKFVEQVSELNDDMRSLFESDIKKKDELTQEYDKFVKDYGNRHLNNWYGLTEGEVLEKIKEKDEDVWIYKIIYAFLSDYDSNRGTGINF